MANNQKQVRRLTAEGWKRKEHARLGKVIELIPAPVAINTDKKTHTKTTKNR